MYDKQAVLFAPADRASDDRDAAPHSQTYRLGQQEPNSTDRERMQLTVSTMIPADFLPAPNGGMIRLRDDAGEFVAALTLGAHTVALAGPDRTFTEDGLTTAVSHSIWIRSLPKPFGGIVDLSWIRAALAANAGGVPDVLAIAMQYVRGAPPIYQHNMQIAGDAAYGPVKKSKRREGSDFNDYLGVTWNYPEGFADHPERQQFRCLDCSGYMRMIWGFRNCMEGSRYKGSIPLSYAPATDPGAIPRRANEMYESGPGIVVIEDCGERPCDYSALAVGDLVFFDADTGDGPRLDHVGMYLGRDEAGHERFISSRKTRNGPTMADEGGASILDGDGYYAQAFRAARRL